MTRDQETSFRQRLHTEGRRTTPEFSPLTHERIMTALRTVKSGSLETTAVAQPSPARLLFRIAAPLAAAAAIAVMIWMNLQPPAPPANPTVEISLPTPAFPTEIIAPVRQLAPSATSINQAKYAYLDRDARRLATFVADQLPTFDLSDNPPQPPR